MKCVVVAGSTATAAIDGLSAAGATPARRRHTPAADLELLRAGAPVSAPVVPVSPAGCPTPAVVTRAVAALGGVAPVGVDAGMAESTPAVAHRVGADPGADIREEMAVPGAQDVFERARDLGAGLEEERILVGETVPGGTTTAKAVLRALGERAAVSSSLADPPRALKASVVETALAARDLDPGGAAGDPLRAVEAVGDPVLAGVAGMAEGALRAGTAVTLAGGTQLAAAAAILRHRDVTAPLELATTSFVAGDDDAAIETHADALDLDLVVTDPRFDRGDHPALDAYCAGEAKEGVAMGGALAAADRAGIPMREVRDRVTALTDRLLSTAEVVEA